MGENFYFGGLSHQALEVILRLPPLYLMDAILLQDVGFSVHGAGKTVGQTSFQGHGVRLSEAPENQYLTEDGIPLDPEEAQRMIRDSNTTVGLHDLYSRFYGEPDIALIPYLFELMSGLVLYLAAFYVMTLSLRHLLIFYAYFLALVAIPLSYLSHYIMIDTLKQMSVDSDPGNAEWFIHKYFTSLTLTSLFNLRLETRAIFANYFIQSALSLILSSVLRFHLDRPGVLFKVVTISLVSPNLLAMAGVPIDVLGWSALMSMAVPILLAAMVLASVFRTVTSVVLRTIRRKRQEINNYGLNTFVESEWTRLRVPVLLRTFWLTRLGMHLFQAFAASHDITSGAMFDSVATLEIVQGITKDVVTRGANTMIALLGMTSIVSSICHYIGSVFYLILSAEEEEEKSVASVSAVLFFVLALQTGLTGLEPDKRFARLCKNLCLLLTALFHFIHNMVSPVLMGLSASHSHNNRKHVRALLICAFLVIAPIALMTALWQNFSVGTWLLAVSAFCIEVIVKVTVTVSVYLLFLYDQYYQSGTWEQLDDSVYYVKSVGNSVEFCFAVFLFCNGGWILLFESGGTIRAFMMLIHAYCNIWLEAKSGWQTFIKRRTAVAKINSLPDATPEQLAELNDVCAICYQNMTSAKVTRCSHFFHNVCLRKWLYVQDSCPLCHATLYQKGALVTNNGTQRQQENQQIDDQMAAGTNDRQRNLLDAQAAQVMVVNGNDVIDNDELEEEQEEDLDEESDTGDEHDLGEYDMMDIVDPVTKFASADNLGVNESTSSDERPSDEDLIYDSMEDYGESSGDEMLEEELEQNNEARL